MKFRAAVIGLGNIGFKFSYDLKRTGTWSHVDAYNKCPSTELTAAVEIDKATIDLFHTQYPDIPVYPSVEELFSRHTIDIVSICVPTKLHYTVFSKICKYPVKAVFCEKPLALSVEESEKIVEIAQRVGIILAVNYTRRWQNTYRYAKNLIDEGKIGKITAITAYYPGQIFNIGSHLFDAVRMISGFQPKDTCAIKVSDPSDPSLSGWFRSKDGVFFSFVTTGKHDDLIFEIDVIGDQGRIRILENGEKIEYYSFQESKLYTSYRELKRNTLPLIPSNDRFVEAILNISDAICGAVTDVACSGSDGLYVDMMIAAVLNASHTGKVIPVECKDS